jgi:hypothetical protein
LLAEMGTRESGFKWLAAYAMDLTGAGGIVFVIIR